MIDDPAAPETPIRTGTFVEPADARIAQPEHTVRGRVLRPSGDPLPGAEIRLVSFWLPAGVAAPFRFHTTLASGPPLAQLPHVASIARTGEDGAFEVRYREGGPRSLVVLVGGRPVRIIAGISDESAHDIVVSDDLPAVAGRVVRLLDGSPVAGATVLYRAEWPDGVAPLPGSGLLARETRTDTDGRWRLHPPSGPAKLHIVSTDSGALYDEWIDVPISGVLEVEHALWGSDTIRGRVVDGVSGVPVAGARVALDITGLPEIAAGTTDAEGRFHLENTPFAPYSTVQLRVEAKGYARSRTLGPASAEPGSGDEVEVRIWRPAGLRLRCLDTDGRPVRDVLVHAVSSYAQQRIHEGTAYAVSFEDEAADFTHADGRVELPRLHPGSHSDLEVTFYVDGIPVLERRFPPLEPSVVCDLGDIRLEPTRTLRGFVLSVDGEPVAGATVFAAPSRREDGEADVRQRVVSAIFSGRGRRAESASDGAFTIAGLPPGIWDLYAYSLANPSLLLPGVVVPSGEDPAPLEIRLPRQTPLRGRVLDAEGAPVAGIGVVIQLHHDLPMRQQILIETDADGRFSFPGFGPDDRDVPVQVVVPVAEEGDVEEQMPSWKITPSAGPVDLRLPVSR